MDCKSLFFGIVQCTANNSLLNNYLGLDLFWEKIFKVLLVLHTHSKIISIQSSNYLAVFLYSWSTVACDIKMKPWKLALKKKKEKRKKDVKWDEDDDIV